MNGAGEALSIETDLFLVVSGLRKSVTDDLERRQPRLPHLKVAELYDDENDLLRPNSQPAVTASYSYRSQLFFSTRWMVPNYCLNQSESERKRKRKA